VRALVVVANERINSGRETRSDSEEASVDVVTARHSERIDLVSDARLRKSRFARSCGGPGRPFKEGNASAATLGEKSNRLPHTAFVGARHKINVSTRRALTNEDGRSIRKARRDAGRVDSNDGLSAQLQNRLPGSVDIARGINRLHNDPKPPILSVSEGLSTVANM
jgi:hypothetical protein